MSCKRITAYIRAEMLGTVEKALQDIQVPGLSVSEVRGYGEYADLNSSNWLVNHLRLELYVPGDQAGKIADVIMQHAHTGMKGDGIVTIEEVDQLMHIRDLDSSL